MRKKWVSVYIKKKQCSVFFYSAQLNCLLLLKKLINLLKTEISYLLFGASPTLKMITTAIITVIKKTIGIRAALFLVGSLMSFIF